MDSDAAQHGTANEYLVPVGVWEGRTVMVATVGLGLNFG